MGRTKRDLFPVLDHRTAAVPLPRGSLGGIVIIRKRLISLLLTLALLSCLAPMAMAEEEISVVIDGQAMDGAFLYEGTTMVPLRKYCELAMPDCTVSWDNESRTATVEAPGLLLTAQHESEYIIANERYLYTGPFCWVDDDGAFYLPIRVLSKALGATVYWDEGTRSVTITTGGGPLLSGDLFYSSDAVYWLSRIINAESRGESLEGQIAVGNVVMNRVNSPLFPNSIYNVIFQCVNGNYQFSPAGNGAIYYTPTQSSVTAAKLVLDGANTADDSLFFLNPAAATNFWIVRNCTFVTTIGHHSFYV